MSNTEISDYLFFSNDPKYINKVMFNNSNFVTYHLIDEKKILRGFFNTNYGKNNYCEEIDYSSPYIKITCGKWKDNKLIHPPVIYTQCDKDSNKFYINESNKTTRTINLEKIGDLDFATPDSIPYWYYHPKNMRERN